MSPRSGREPSSLRHKHHLDAMRSTPPSPAFLVALGLLAALAMTSAALAGKSGGPFDGRSAFVPDVYPTRRAAIEGLADRLTRFLRPESEKSSGSSIRIRAEDDTDELAVRTLIDALHRDMPDANVAADGARSSSASGRELVFVLSADDASLAHPTAVGRYGRIQRGGSDAPSAVRAVRGNSIDTGAVLRAASGSGVEFFESARYLDKPWADDWDSFLAMASPAQRWVRGQSAEPAAGRDEAVAAAQASAANALVPLIREHSRRSAFARGPKGDAAIRQQALAWFRHNQPADVFVRKYTRTYGDVYDAAILVDASDSSLDEIARQIATAARIQRHRTGIAWIAGSSLAVAIPLLYLVMNTLTKGYFTWRLRSGAVLAALAGAAAIAALA